MLLRQRKSRWNKPVKGTFRGTDSNVETWVEVGWGRWECNKGGWRLGVYTNDYDVESWYWVARSTHREERDYNHYKNGTTYTLAEAKSACWEAAK
jgi:hypothetical protein